MVEGGHGDQERLLDRANIAVSTRSSQSSSAYEMEALSSDDIGTHKKLPPPYPSSNQNLLDKEDVEGQGQFRRESLNKYASNINSDIIEQQSTTSRHAASFRTRTSFQRAPSFQRSYQRFMRFILRSGTYASHLQYDPANQKLSNGTRSYTGWRGGLRVACTAAGTVLLLNIIFSIFAATTAKSGMHIGNIYQGDCETVARADSALHIAINVMGTCLLGASNYTMQCLGSPTRRDVDEAHCRGRYLDIGLPSIRNLKGRRKKTLFGLLVMSTMPLHFLWNSAVFTTTQKVDYNVHVVTPEFLSSSVVDCSQLASYAYYNSIPATVSEQYSLDPLSQNDSWVAAIAGSWYRANTCNNTKELHTNATQNKLTKLSTTDCINTYGMGSTKLANWGHVLAVTKEQPKDSNATVLIQFNYQDYISNYTGQNWVCDPAYLIKNNYKCAPKDIAAASSWSVGTFSENPNNPFAIIAKGTYEIDYCLAQKTDFGGKCQLQYSMVIMICVLLANTIKLICIFWVIKTSREPVLATIGDGIASFLERPDPITAERPFLSRKKGRTFKPLSTRLAKRWTIKQTKHRWWQAPSGVRWVVTIVLCTITIVAVAALLKMGNENVNGYDDNGHLDPYSLGFGIYNENAIVDIFPWSENGNSDQTLSDGAFNSNAVLIQMVAVANIPQVIVSSLYFAYNTVYTSMVSSDEFSRFTTHRKALRTTNPIGEQRSTYWLSLPWTYSLPLSVSSMTIHYLISQSLFIARTEVLSPIGEVESASFMELGYSPLAILLALLFGTGMVVAMILSGLRKFKTCVLVGNNSFAIAAACQRPEGDEGAHLRKVQWGVVRRPGNGVPGHCTFTSHDVEEPEIGQMYI